MSTTKRYFVYIILCANQAYYTGYTTDLKRRWQEHLDGSNKSKFTRAFKAISLCQSWELPNKSCAMKAESYIKKLSHAQKKTLIANPKLLESV